jgi:excisionase family DNA binding protein
MKRRLQSPDTRPEQPARTIDSPYITSKEAVEYLRVKGLPALYRLIREHHLPHGRLGRVLRFDKRELDAFIRGFGSALELVRAKRSA